MTQGNRTAIVTGGLSGMGRAIASRLIRDGIDVTIGSRRGDDAEAVRAILGPQAKGTRVAALDVRSSESVDAFVAEVAERRGGVDILVNAAGLYEEAPIVGHADAVWEGQIDTNLSGTFRMIRAAMPHMKAAGWGRIVNCSLHGGAYRHGEQRRLLRVQGGASWSRPLRKPGGRGAWDHVRVDQPHLGRD